MWGLKAKELLRLLNPVHAGEDLGPGLLRAIEKGFGAVPWERMVKRMRSYKVTYERDEDGWWVARVRGVRGVHTQGRTIGDARRRIREALALAIGDRAAAGAELKDDVRLPAEVRKKLRAADAARKRLEAEKAKAQESIAEAVWVLTRKLRLSVRDVGDLVDLSHQRVQQLVQEA